MIIHYILQKPMLCSIRSFGSSTTAITRTISTPMLETTLKNTDRIKRRLFRYPMSHQLFSVVSLSTNSSVEETEENNHAGDEGQKFNNEQQKEHKFMKGPNPGLASVISQGMKSLEHTAEEIQYKTRRTSLSQPHKKPSFKNGRADEMDPRQLAEGQRILDVATDCLEQLALQEEHSGQRQRDVGNSNGLVLFGEPIVLLECEVNRNVRQAKIYYTLPYGILLDNRINQRLYQEIMVKVQNELVVNGGAKLLARNVHTRLSYYYPPRIKFFPATDEMVQSAIEEFMV